jgi:HEPN domain-containing protein
VESALELLAVLAESDDERLVLRQRQAELWRGAARSGRGILRASFLEKALDIARTHGLADLARELRVEIQEITEEELDLRASSWSASTTASWPSSREQSFSAFGSYGPPGGEADRVEREVEEQMKSRTRCSS